jgi:hypothetical protein
MRLRRLQAPAGALWERARRRARERGLEFAIAKDAIVIPMRCPALGVPIRVGQVRTENSPSLDRIDPSLGYIPGNVRVISDKANRLKSDRSLRELRERSSRGNPEFRHDYGLLAAYVERESLLREISHKARAPGREGAEWRKIQTHLERIFMRQFGSQCGATRLPNDKGV